MYKSCLNAFIVIKLRFLEQYQNTAKHCGIGLETTRAFERDDRDIYNMQKDKHLERKLFGSHWNYLDLQRENTIRDDWLRQRDMACQRDDDR